MGKNSSRENRIYIFVCKLAFLMSALISILLFFECFKPSVVNDEIFSLQVVERNWNDIISITARDVHPPFYYLWLKIFTDVGRNVGLLIPFAKLASLVPIILLQIYSFVYLKRESYLKAALFSLFVVACPQFMTYGTQVRMYSLGMCFVTASYILSQKLFTKNVKIINGIPFVMCSLLAGFTQYFALICVILIYIGLLIGILNNRLDIKKWLAWVGISVLGYFPWLIVAIRQITTVNNGGYWIDEITTRTLIDYIQFAMNPNVYAYHMGTIAGGILLLLIITVVFIQSKELTVYNWTGLLLPILLISVGVGISIVSQPIFTERYIFLSLGVFWIAIADLISKFQKNKKPVITTTVNSLLMVVVAIYLYFNSSWFIRTEGEYAGGWEQMTSTFEREMNRGDVFLTNNGGVLKVLSYMYPENSVGYYWRQQMDPLFCELSSNLADLRDVDAIMDYIPQDNAMWILEKSDLPEFHFLKDISKEELYSLNCENRGTFNLEGVMIDIIKVSKK